MTGPTEETQDSLPDVPATDVAAPGATPRAATARHRGRTLALLLMMGIALGGGAVAWEQRQVAAGWQERAVALEQQRDDAIGRSEALSEQLGELANLVQLSVEDLATLEERLAELAGEKAQAEDRATVTRDELRTLATRVQSAFQQLTACVDDLFALQSDTIAAYNSLARGNPVDVGPFNERQRVMVERCSAARQAGESAVALAARLR